MAGRASRLGTKFPARSYCCHPAAVQLGNRPWLSRTFSDPTLQETTAEAPRAGGYARAVAADTQSLSRGRSLPRFPRILLGDRLSALRGPHHGTPARSPRPPVRSLSP